MIDVHQRAARLYAKGQTLREIGAELSIDESTVRRILAEAAIERYNAALNVGAAPSAVSVCAPTRPIQSTRRR